MFRTVQFNLKRKLPEYDRYEPQDVGLGLGVFGLSRPTNLGSRLTADIKRLDEYM
jgi:hypothetical protein